MRIASLCKSNDELTSYIFGEADFLELFLEKLGINLYDYPNLRDLQIQQFEHLDCANK